jgi:hypothetical protein
MRSRFSIVFPYVIPRFRFTLLLSTMYWYCWRDTHKINEPIKWKKKESFNKKVNGMPKNQSRKSVKT